MKTFVEWIKENAASQMQNSFTSLGNPITGAADQKVIDYAQRILKGENPNMVLQGQKTNGAMWNSVMKKVEELKQNSSQKTTSQQVTFAGKDPMSLESPKGGKPEWVVVTAQGSRYLITNDGMVLRNKSFHANTGGEDTGLQRWSDKIEFFDTKEPLVQGGMQNLNFADAVQYLFDKGKIALSKSQNGDRIAVVFKDGKWTPATLSDAMPKAIQQNPQWANIIIKASRWGLEPKLGWQPLDYNESNGVLSRVHNGSPVTHGIKL